VEYRYEHFKRQLLIDDMAFTAGPTPGEPLPDFDLATSEGGRVRRSELLGQPLLVTIGSFTCPMTADSSEILKRLHRAFGDKVHFLTLYVREAHPGERYPQPSTFEQKREHARAYKTRDEIPWPIAVDDVDGSLHRRLDPKPNAVYIIDSNGVVAFRALWSNDERPLRDALKSLTAGLPLAKAEHQRRLIPMLGGIGKMDEMLSRAGREARRDVLRQAPPLYGLARLAGLFRPLPPAARTVAAVTLATGSAYLAVAGLQRARQAF